MLVIASKFQVSSLFRRQFSPPMNSLFSGSVEQYPFLIELHRANRPPGFFSLTSLVCSLCGSDSLSSIIVDMHAHVITSTVRLIFFSQ